MEATSAVPKPWRCNASVVTLLTTLNAIQTSCSQLLAHQCRKMQHWQATNSMHAQLCTTQLNTSAKGPGGETTYGIEFTYGLGSTSTLNGWHM